MKMTRRHLLKLLGLAPLAGAVAVRAKPVPAPPTKLLQGGLRRGELWVMVGHPKIGKTRLAQLISKLQPQFDVLDSVLPPCDEFIDALLVRRRSVLVVLADRAVISRYCVPFKLYCRTDEVFEVTSRGCFQDETTGSSNVWWHCRYLKSRSGMQEKTWHEDGSSVSISI